MTNGAAGPTAAVIPAGSSLASSLHATPSRRLESAMKLRAFALVLSGLLATGCGSEHAPQLSEETAQVEVQPYVVRGNIDFIDGYQNGVFEAQRRGKPMLLFFTAGWCHFCHEMAADAFTQEQVVQLSERFVCVLIDADREPAICQKYQVRGYPTVQFVSSRAVPLNRVVGKRPGHQLVMEMQAALQAVARRETLEAEIIRQ